MLLPYFLFAKIFVNLHGKIHRELADTRNYTDFQLVSLLKAGDHDAFTEIYTRYNLLLLQHAYNKVRDREEARDVVQETFSKLWEKRESLQIDENLSGYLYTSVRNLILNHYAHQKVHEKYEQSMAKYFQEDHSISSDQRIREKQLEDAILKEIELLPAKMKEVFTLSRTRHLSHKEIATQLNISERTVSSHITHALKILKTRFGPLMIICSILY